ncbi:adipose-secreted signaling protein-like [Synchiropus picturatus]
MHLSPTNSASMATGRKDSTSKGGGVRFNDNDQPTPGSVTQRDDQSDSSSLIAVLEKDGSYLVKAGFLRSHHCYEVTFTLPDVPALGKEPSCLPTSSPSRKPPNLKVRRINKTLEGGLKVTCEYKTHQEGVLQEEIALGTGARKETRLKVKFQAKVIDPHHGTPVLLDGVKCLGAQRGIHTRRGSDRKKM